MAKNINEKLGGKVKWGRYSQYYQLIDTRHAKIIIRCDNGTKFEEEFELRVEITDSMTFKEIMEIIGE